MVKNSPTLGTSNSYVASTLRKDFQVLFVIYIPNTPSWLYKCKLFQINKVKTKSPLGATAGGIPPKWSHFIAKIRKHAKYDST
jgi:hypothetical protein